ncbi:ImmA/IrrE family metallo-endopeptidase [Pseudoalteromonas luteoviolacea]|uniref:ImmA/IrrE family metallo-endopeptidase n=1 Tax=Pseudoalteromonas luteoviolacea TaxID=43657 RepID=UPI001B35CEC5|nr:ImmA/IrrE family metallo-endopeptidase [Pseudoalteromonas luteoviolacea]MBQ4811281.1 ImmA/IrrE family metallo-endopeptidase [Pseudoalteromonas luteoviolacea]
MNTVKKGDELEKAVFNFFSNDIEQGKFWANKDYCKIFHQKGYYSRDREKDITFDISIEIYVPGQTNYSLLVLIECKNYNHRVPVDDIEEFHSKIQQVSGAKGIVVSTNSFQEGALKFSKSKKIGLLRYFSPENSEWVLTRSSSTVGRNVEAIKTESIKPALQQENFISKGFDCYCYYNSLYTNSIYDLFENIIKSAQSSFSSESIDTIRTHKPLPQVLVPFLESAYIEAQSKTLLDSIGYSGGYVNEETLTDFVSEHYGVKLELCANLPAGVLGTIDFTKKEICVDLNQCETKERLRFTIAHELGHLILGHSEYILSETCYGSHFDENRDDIDIKDIMRLEWQANQFASSLLLPKEQFVKAFVYFARSKGISDRGFGALFVDEQPCNRDALNFITLSLMRQFKVSKAAIYIRLKQLGIVRESLKKPENAMDLFSLNRSSKVFYSN